MNAKNVRVAAWSSAILALAVFVGFAATLGPPDTPEGHGFERDLQLALLGVVAAALVIGWRWEPAGGVLLVFAGIALGVLATVAFPPLSGLAIAAIFMLPGVTFIGLWAARHGRATQAAVAALVAAGLAAGGVGAARVHGHYFGPAHPESSLEEPAPSPVVWIWAGALTPTSITVNANVDGDAAQSRLAVAADRTLTDPRWLAPASGSAIEASVASFEIAGLTPGSTYHYAVEVGGSLERARAGTFRTPLAGPHSFTIALGSCARTGSNGAVFDAIREREPLLYLMLGDIHYGNIEADDPPRYRRALDDTLSATAQSALYRAVPVAYIWDDHDFGPNDADSASPGREAAQSVYREYVPHHALQDAEGAIYQAFTIGRVRFILTDTRSARSDLTMLGEAQTEWLKAELLAAHRAGLLAVWANTVPWVTEPSAGADDWGGYVEERAELAQFIAEHALDRLVMLSGDAHMIAIDDGTNTDYSEAGGAGFPLFHAAALDRPGSTKGGPYSEGAYPGAGQFGAMEVIDDGGSTLRVVWTGLDWERHEIVDFEMTFDVPDAGTSAPRGS